MLPDYGSDELTDAQKSVHSGGQQVSPGILRAAQSRGEVALLTLEPRGLCRVKAAAYVGVSPALFDEMVRDRRMPQPKRINSRTVWDRRQLDDAFEALPDGEDRNPWDEDDAA